MHPISELEIKEGRRKEEHVGKSNTTFHGRLQKVPGDRRQAPVVAAPC
jgi:hypothetical protein